MQIIYFVIILGFMILCKGLTQCDDYAILIAYLVFMISCGCRITVLPKLPKLVTGVRLPPSAYFWSVMKRSLLGTEPLVKISLLFGKDVIFDVL